MFSQILLFTLILASCNHTVQVDSEVDTDKNESIAEQANYQDSSSSEEIINKIAAIQEVKQLMKEKVSDEKRVSINIIKKPAQDFKFYWVQVGISNKYLLQPVFNFYLDQYSKDVFILDTKSDSLLTLNNWRSVRGW